MFNALDTATEQTYDANGSVEGASGDSRTIVSTVEFLVMTISEYEWEDCPEWKEHCETQVAQRL